MHQDIQDNLNINIPNIEGVHLHQDIQDNNGDTGKSRDILWESIGIAMHVMSTHIRVTSKKSFQPRGRYLKKGQRQVYEKTLAHKQKRRTKSNLSLDSPLCGTIWPCFETFPFD